MTTPYDEVAYPTTAFHQTHPARMATHAALFGLPFAPVETARVLDIGCGNGGNLVPMAVGYPRARFVGLDLSERAIAMGRETVGALGLDNIRLEVGNLIEADFGAASFDYVIAHGVYSWIPEAARDALIASIRHHLAPNGVAFVSHNALPGGHLRLLIREMLLFRLRGVEGVQARVDAAWGHLEKIIETYAKTDDAFQVAVRLLCEEIRTHPKAVLAHDELGEVYHPLYLGDFLEHAGRHGLQFLTEASARRCGEGFRPPYALDDPDFDVLAHAQQLDFDILRPYRENLLVRAEIALNRRPEPTRLYHLYAASAARMAEPGVFDVGQSRFKLTDERLIAAIQRLGASWPNPVRICELIDDEDRARALLRLYWAGVMSLDTAPMPFAEAVGDRPQAFPLARLQASRGQTRLTTPHHVLVDIGDEAGLRFIASLDGSRTVAQIIADVAAESGRSDEALDGEVREKLEGLRRLPLLV